MNTLFLIPHIAGAIALGIVIILSVVSIAGNYAKHYLNLFYILGGGLVLQAVTGSLLELSSSHPALFVVFCTKIAFYLGAVMLTQIALYMKMKKINMPVSYQTIAYSGLITLLAMFTTGILLG